MPMSRAEAICACHNIIELVEQMDDKLPDTFSSSVADKAKSMLDYILKSPQYPRVTEKMHQALVNMWSGLQKWNRKGDFNDNLFDGLEAVIAELQSIQHTFDNAENDNENNNNADNNGVTTLGLEEMSDVVPVTSTDTAQEITPRQERRAPHLAGITVEQIVKAREDAISVVLNQLHEKHITVVDTKGIRHGITTEILKKTSSDRTTQLLWAMFYAGKISGIMQLGEALSTEAGETNKKQM